MKFGTIIILIIIALIAFYILLPEQATQSFIHKALPNSFQSFIEKQLNKKISEENNEEYVPPDITPQILGYPSCTSNEQCRDTYTDYDSERVQCNPTTGECELK